MFVERRCTEVKEAVVPVVQELLKLDAASQRASLLGNLAVAALQGYEHCTLLDIIYRSDSDECSSTLQTGDAGKKTQLGC
jgi:hypothetical protein